MKRLPLLVILLVAISAFTSSCQKCSVCTSQNLAGEAVIEYCGTELDVRDFEDFFIDSVTEIGEIGFCERGPEE